MATAVVPSHGLEIALLGLLRKHPRHAYELYRGLQRTEALGIVWHLKQSHLYALLTKLEESGYVMSVLESHGAKPPRKMLHLTSRGHEAFVAWFESPVEHGRDFRLEFLAKLYFAAEEGAHVVSTLIRRQREVCQQWLTDLRQQIVAISSDRPFERLVLQFRASQLDAIVSWLDTCEQTLVP